jgi:hypothetical protein
MPHDDTPYLGPERRTNTCSEHQEVTAIRSKLNLLLLVFLTLLGLIGYNIDATQKIEVRITEQITKLGGQISSTNVRARAVENVIDEAIKRIDDHEQRLRYLENRREK